MEFGSKGGGEGVPLALVSLRSIKKHVQEEKDVLPLIPPHPPVCLFQIAGTFLLPTSVQLPGMCLLGLMSVTGLQ